ncbi:MAG: nucleotidyltransferase domain-containing protein [Candidatus Pacearchaeota archaeon]
MTKKFIIGKEIQDKINPILKKAKKDKDVLAVALFGSYVQGKEYYRDIDVCIILKQKFSNLEMSKKHVTYAGIVSDKIDVSIFQQLPIYIRMRVLKEGKFLIIKDQPEMYKLAFQTIKEFNLYEKIYKMYLKAIENG